VGWDQAFIGGWHLLPRACARMLLNLKGDFERGIDKGWDHCMSLTISAPLRITPRALRDCFHD